MNERFHFCVLSLLVCLAPGCVPESAGEEPFEDAEGGVISSNIIARNSLTPQMISSSILTPSLLSQSATNVIQGPTAQSADARLLLQYAVRCALGPGQSFAFSWTDAGGAVHDEVYEGQIGLAPGWAGAPLSGETEQRLVSACLAALVNWYGVGVYVSMRSGQVAPAVDVTTDELDDYPNVEGAFWGNLFAPSPYLNACYHPGHVSLARAEHRDCAAGHIATNKYGKATGHVLPCGLIALAGPCTGVCQGFDSEGQHYTSCVNHPGVAGSPTTSAVITTALP